MQIFKIYSTLFLHIKLTKTLRSICLNSLLNTLKDLTKYSLEQIECDEETIYYRLQSIVSRLDTNDIIYSISYTLFV